MSYTPLPGSIPARVVAYLQDQAQAGRQWLPGGELADLIGEPSIANYLGAPLKYGCVTRRSVKGNLRMMEYALGDGTPPAAPADLEADVPMHDSSAIRSAPGPLFPGVAAAAAAVDDVHPGPAPTPSPATRRKPAAAASAPATRPATGFRAGLFTDGSVVLEVDGRQLKLDKLQVAELAGLLWRTHRQ